VDPARRIGRIAIMEGARAAELIAGQVEALKKTLEAYKSAVGLEIATDPAKQDSLWVGRRSALQVLQNYDPRKKPLTMIECVVIPRDEEKISGFIATMEQVLGEEGVVAGTHGHAGDCNFHIYLLLNLSEKADREKLIHVMTKITQKVREVGGSMSAEHADGRTRGVILPFVFGLDLFDLFVSIKRLMDPAGILHPGVKIIPGARDKKLGDAITELVGIEEKDSTLNLSRFRDLSHLYGGACSFCSQCADICPVFEKLGDEFATRSQAAPAFKRALAIALDGNTGLEPLRKDPLFRKIFDLCLLCGQCTFKCATNAGMRDIVIRMREQERSRVIAPAIAGIMEKPGLYDAAIRVLGVTQGLWSNGVSRSVLAALPEGLLPSRLPAGRYLPKLAAKSIRERYPELVDIPASQADVALFYGCTSDLFEEPLADSFIKIARANGWNLSLPSQRCCGEPFSAVGNLEEAHRLARYNVDRLAEYRHVVAFCPSCLYGIKAYVRDFATVNDKAYEEKAKALVGKLYDPAGFMMEVVGAGSLAKPAKAIDRKVAVHLSCHEKLGRKMTGSTNQTRAMLSAVPGLQIVEMAGADQCCGLAGPWGLGSHYDLTLRLRQEKIANIAASGVDTVTSWCFGCMLQMRDGLSAAGSAVAVTHPLELLAEGYGSGAAAK
jgi:Fe-S oxidoreductase